VQFARDVVSIIVFFSGHQYLRFIHANVQ
jgi:hypothetical protein